MFIISSTSFLSPDLQPFPHSPHCAASCIIDDSVIVSVRVCISLQTEYQEGVSPKTNVVLSLPNLNCMLVVADDVVSSNAIG